MSTRLVVRSLLDAVEARDLEAMERLLVPEATWQNVPHAPAVGREAVLAMFDPILLISDRVEWELCSASYEGSTAWLERVDRFWIDGVEHAVRCNGVFEVDADRSSVRSVRDYVDLGEWRQRIAPALTRWASSDPSRIVERHLEAVRRRDLPAMSADYATDAVLVRGPDEYAGRRTIAAYFRTVPDRLGDATLELGAPDPSLAVRWRIVDRGRPVASGTDRYTVVSGRITRQVVELDGTDF